MQGKRIYCFGGTRLDIVIALSPLTSLSQNRLSETGISCILFQGFSCPSPSMLLFWNLSVFRKNLRYKCPYYEPRYVETRGQGIMSTFESRKQHQSCGQIVMASDSDAN